MDKWISVKDKMPEELKTVLVVYDLQYQRVFAAFRENGLWLDGFQGSGIRVMQQDLITHWMPLPEPPKGE